MTVQCHRFAGGCWMLLAVFVLLTARPLSTDSQPAVRTFYVDSDRGADSADGTAPERAWRSLDRVNRASLRPGDKVLFRRGRIWRGQLRPQSGGFGHVMTYGAFGDGPKPVLLGSVAMSRREDWRATGSGTWVTISPGCGEPGSLSLDVGNIIFDDGRSTGSKKWREDALTEDGDFFYDPGNCQVMLWSRGNPAAVHTAVELALNRHIVNQSGQSYIIYESLHLRFGAAHGIGGGKVHDITVRDCDLSFIGGGHQKTLSDGRPVRFGNGVEFWNDADHCLVEGCRLWEIYDAALTNQGDGVNLQENIVYRSNVIWNSEYCFEFWNRGPSSRTRNIRFEHNTCVDAGHGWGHGQRPDPNGRHLVFGDNTAVTSDVRIRFNIFSNATDSNVSLRGRDWTASLDLDYNCLFQPQGPLLLWRGERVDAAGFEAFRAKRGLGIHSIVADPKFVDPAMHDYRLAADSPARLLSDADGPAGALR